MNLFGLTLKQLQDLCAAEGFPRFAAKQMCDWIYNKRCTSIDAMTNLSLKVRSRLNEIAKIERTESIDCQISKDGTRKYLFSIPLAEGEGYVESVMIPDGDRATLCVSCQVGCKMGCRFCVTGKQGFHGHLTTAQILNQIFSIPESERLTNVVYMGMGEPMDNYEAVLQSTQVLTADWGLGWSPHRITVSSVGLIEPLRRFIEESECHLAVSLHNPIASERLEIMPMEKAFPIAKVVEMLKEYKWNGQRRISFEYTMFKGLNDDIAHAAKLVELLKGLPCRVNLIRFHASPETPYKTSSMGSIERFEDYLNSHGVTCTLRASRGEDIMAACGLLAGKKGETL